MPQIKLVAPADFHRLANARRTRGVGVIRQSASMLHSTDDAGRVLRWRFSDGSTDRLSDRIDPTGWDYSNYLRAGGPVLFAHDNMAPPIGGTRSLWSDSVALTGEIEFCDNATYEFRARLLRLVDAGFLKGGSVGFLPKRWTYSDDPARRGGIDFSEVELLEFSLTPTPALPTALPEARSLFGIDTAPVGRWAERALGRGNAFLSRSELLRLREIATPPVRSRAEDLRRAFAIPARLAGKRRSDISEPSAEQWALDYAAQEQREVDERRARAGQLCDALRLSIPSW